MTAGFAVIILIGLIGVAASKIMGAGGDMTENTTIDNVANPR